MNIFVTDKDPVKSAQFLDDKRVKHMVKENIELLGIFIHSVTGQWYIDFPLWDAHLRNEPNFLYNHPLSRWVRKDRVNMSWLYRHTVALFDEYQYRFERKHPFEEVFIRLRPLLGEIILDKEPKSFHNSSLFKELEVVTAYRKTMKVKWFETDKIKPVLWTGRGEPSWLLETGKLEI